MSIQQFREFYREKGVQTIDSLADPQPALIKKLPSASTLHYLGDQDNPGLDTSDPLMKGYSSKVAFHNVRFYDPSHTVGNVRTPDMQAKIAEFLKANRNFMYIKELKQLATITANQLEVIDYSWLESFNKINPTKINVFDQVESLLWTVTKTISEINLIGKRNHFVVLPVPGNLVAKSQLDTKALSSQPQLSNTFYGLDEQLLRHVWMFINPKLRKASIFGSLSEDDLKTINFIFKMYDGKYAIVNLGYLFSFIKGSNNITLANRVNSKTFVDVQKYYLRGMISLQTFDLNGATLKAQEEAQALQQNKLKQVDESEEEGSELDQRFLQDTELEASSVRDETTYGITSSEIKSIRRSAKEGDPSEVQPEINSKLTDKVIDEDLQALEEIQARKIAKKVTSNSRVNNEVTETEQETGYTSEIIEDVETIQRELFTNRSPEAALTHKLNVLVDEGRVTSSEFRRKKQLIAASKNLPNPYGGDKTIEQASIVTKQDLVIDPEAVNMVVPETVIDKSMASSTLNIIGPKYDTSIIYKDMLACVQYAQKGGVIIKDHSVERRVTNHGEYDVHTLEITPLNGQPSLIRARLPVVNEEGSFNAKGSSYRMRSQRVD